MIEVVAALVLAALLADTAARSGPIEHADDPNARYLGTYDGRDIYLCVGRGISPGTQSRWYIWVYTKTGGRMFRLPIGRPGGRPGSKQTSATARPSLASGGAARKHMNALADNPVARRQIAVMAAVYEGQGLPTSNQILNGAEQPPVWPPEFDWTQVPLDGPEPLDWRPNMLIPEDNDALG